MADITPDPVLTVREVMRPAVTTVERDAHIASAAYLMKKSHDNALVVITDGASRVPVTLVCDSDVTQAVADGRNPEETRLNELSLPDMVGLAPDLSVAEAAERMLRVSAAYAPVVEDGRLVGLVDLAALCRGLLMERREERLAEART
jgi:predicted transcriptional regulator